MPARSASRCSAARTRRFLTGSGQYTDDVVLHGQTYGVFLRSPHAHARIRSIDVEAARRRRACVDIFTGADLLEAKVGGLPCGWLIHSTRRHADERAEAPGAGPRQGAPRRRPGRAGRRRDLAAGARTRPSWSRSTTRSCRRSSTSRRADAAGRRRGARRRARTTSATTGGTATRRRSTRPSPGAAHVTTLELRQQPADPQRHRAARRQRGVHRATTTATRSTSPTRTRTSSGC